MIALSIILVAIIAMIVWQHFFFKKDAKEREARMFPKSEHSEHLSYKIHIFNAKHEEDLTEFAESITGQNLEEITVLSYLLYPDLDRESLKDKWEEIKNRTDLSQIPKKLYYTDEKIQEHVFNEKVFCVCGHVEFVNEQYILLRGEAMKKESDDNGKKQTKAIPVSPREEVYV